MLRRRNMIFNQNMMFNQYVTINNRRKSLRSIILSVVLKALLIIVFSVFYGENVVETEVRSSGSSIAVGTVNINGDLILKSSYQCSDR